jgi:hypothetical protein
MAATQYVLSISLISFSKCLSTKATPTSPELWLDLKSKANCDVFFLAYLKVYFVLCSRLEFDRLPRCRLGLGGA